MRVVLLLGVVLNFAGAARLLAPALSAVTSPDGERVHAGYLQFRLFTGGAAVTFGSLYLYLFVNPAYVTPFLAFGAALKTWAFVVSALLHRRKLMTTRDFLEFGVSNAVVAVLFWIYLAII